MRLGLACGMAAVVGVLVALASVASCGHDVSLGAALSPRDAAQEDARMDWVVGGVDLSAAER